MCVQFFLVLALYFLSFEVSLLLIVLIILMLQVFLCNFKKINLYGMIDNIVQFNDIATANSISPQLGVNLIFK